LTTGLHKRELYNNNKENPTESDNKATQMIEGNNGGEQPPFEEPVIAQVCLLVLHSSDRFQTDLSSADFEQLCYPHIQGKI